MDPGESNVAPIITNHVNSREKICEKCYVPSITQTDLASNNI